MQKQTIDPTVLSQGPSGEIKKTGHSNRLYIFFFGWRARLLMENVYGKGLEKFGDEEATDTVANVLLCGLRARPSNNIPAEFDRESLYDLLDDLDEADVREVYLFAMHSLGFISRILAVKPEAAQTSESENQDLPTGTDS